MAEKVEIIDIDAGTATRTLRELKEEVKNLRKALDDCELGSDEFASTLDELTAAQTELKNATKTTNEALEGSYDALVAKMSELKKVWRSTADEVERNEIGQQIASINEQLKEMDASIGNYQRNVGNYSSAFDGVSLQIEGFTGATRSMVGSLDLVEGGLKSMGIESEAAGEMLDKMKGLMVLTNGLNSVKEGVAVFKTLKTATQASTIAQHGLNAAMKANPIGAVVAVVMALVTAMTALVSWLDKAGDSAESLAEKNDKLTESIADQNYELDYNIRLMKAKGASELEALKADYEGKLKIAKDAYAEYQNMVKEANDSKRWLGLASSISEAEQEQIDAAYQTYLELHAEYKKAVDNYNIEVNRVNAERKTQAEKDAEEERKRAKETADAKIAEERRVIAEINKMYHEQAKERSEYWLNELQIRLKRAEEWEQEQKDIVRQQFANGLISEQEYLDQILEIDRIFADKKAKIYEEAELASVEFFEDGTTAFVEGEKIKQDAVKETEEKVTWSTMKMSEKWNAAAGLAGTAFGQTATLLTTLANTQDQTSEEGFEAYKKMSYGAAVMSMLQGIISSWTSAMSLPAPISFITGGIMSAATATLGAIQIDQIKKQTFQNADKGGSTNTASIPSINTAALLSTPINYTTEVQGAMAQENMTDTRVYVVESDITDTVNRVKVAEDESTF